MYPNDVFPWYIASKIKSQKQRTCSHYQNPRATKQEKKTQGNTSTTKFNKKLVFNRFPKKNVKQYFYKFRYVRRPTL